MKYPMNKIPFNTAATISKFNMSNPRKATGIYY